MSDRDDAADGPGGEPTEGAAPAVGPENGMRRADHRLEPPAAAPTISKRETVWPKPPEKAPFRMDAYHFSYTDHAGAAKGPPFPFLVFERGDAVAVLPVHQTTNDVFLVDQVRPATIPQGDLTDEDRAQRRGGWLLETVAGMPTRSPDGSVESLAACALRELTEETGLVAVEGTLEDVGWFWSSPGGTSERIFVFLVTVTGDTRHGDPGGVEHEYEYTVVHRIPMDVFLQRVANWEYHDPKILHAALALLQRRDARKALKATGDPKTFRFE